MHVRMYVSVLIRASQSQGAACAKNACVQVALRPGTLSFRQILRSFLDFFFGKWYIE